MIMEISKDCPNYFVKNKIFVFCVIPTCILYMFWNFIGFVELHKYVINNPKHQIITVSINMLFEVVSYVGIKIVEFESNPILILRNY